jgi:hypothetical protein
MDICVEGESEGENISHKISYKFTNGPYKERQRQLFEVYGTTMLHVALPAVVGIKMCVNGGAENGVISPDQLDPRQFFKGMVDRGVQFEFDEFITKHTVINHEVYAETMFDEPS